MLLRPWDSLGKNTGVGCHALLQGTFLTQGSTFLESPALASRFFTTSATWEVILNLNESKNYNLRTGMVKAFLLHWLSLGEVVSFLPVGLLNWSLHAEFEGVHFWVLEEASLPSSTEEKSSSEFKQPQNQSRLRLSKKFLNINYVKQWNAFLKEVQNHHKNGGSRTTLIT